MLQSQGRVLSVYCFQPGAWSIQGQVEVAVCSHHCFRSVLPGSHRMLERPAIPRVCVWGGGGGGGGSSRFRQGGATGHSGCVCVGGGGGSSRFRQGGATGHSGCVCVGGGGGLQPFWSGWSDRPFRDWPCGGGGGVEGE